MFTPSTCNWEEEAYLLLADPPHAFLLARGEAGVFPAMEELQLRGQEAGAFPAMEELQLCGQEVAARGPSALGSVLANNKQEPVPMHLDSALGIPYWDPEVVGDRWLTTMAVEPLAVKILASLR